MCGTFRDKLSGYGLVQRYTLQKTLLRFPIVCRIKSDNVYRILSTSLLSGRVKGYGEGGYSLGTTTTTRTYFRRYVWQRKTQKLFPRSYDSAPDVFATALTIHNGALCMTNIRKVFGKISLSAAVQSLHDAFSIIIELRKAADLQKRRVPRCRQNVHFESLPVLISLVTAVWRPHNSSKTYDVFRTFGRSQDGQHRKRMSDVAKTFRYFNSEKRKKKTFRIERKMCNVRFSQNLQRFSNEMVIKKNDCNSYRTFMYVF